MIYSPTNLPQDFVTIEDIWERYIHTHDEDDPERWLRVFTRRVAVKDFALGVAEELDAEANGYHEIRDTDDGRVAVFVPPMQGGV